MHSHCQNCINVKKCKFKSNPHGCAIINCHLECGLKFHTCKREEHKYLCLNEQVSCINAGYGCPFKIFRRQMSSHLPSCPASVIECTIVLDHWPVYPSPDSINVNVATKGVVEEKPSEENSGLNVDIASEIASSLMTCRTLWNTYKPYRVNPDHPYTFVCAQAFRRDEYHWHYKNIHNDIHHSLNGLIIERCPLAQYGCKFSRRRLFPAPKGSVLVYNNITGGFGVLPLPLNRDIPSEENSNCDTLVEGTDLLSQLPFEILQRIAYYLDSFSLANLSLTSQHLRNVCTTMLEDRGLVVLQWVKEVQIDGRVTWKMAQYKWFFSKSIDPVTSWCYLEGNNISDHMQGCPFNEKRRFKPEHWEKVRLEDPNVEF